MKISDVESNKAAVNQGMAREKILPEKRPRGTIQNRPATENKGLSPLEQGMAVAQQALQDVPEIREDFVMELKERISKREYEISGAEIADMMLRRRAADRIR